MGNSTQGSQGSRLLFVLVLIGAVILGGWYFLNQRGQQSTNNSISLVKTRTVTLDFRSGPISKSIEQFIADFNPQTRQLLTGGVGYMAHNPKIRWSATSITKTIFNVSAVNAKFGATYLFRVNVMTGEVSPENDNARLLFNQ